MRNQIIAVIEQVARQQGKTLHPITDDLELVDSGLDSLCFAIIVAQLEDRFGFDPLNGEAEVEFPTTFGEFFELYRKVPA
jgi:acyl carrier protein